MPNTRSRRNFGKIRKLPSGRYQASYLGADEERVNAPHTFERERQAQDWLAGIRTDQLRGTLRQPKGKARTLAVYAEDWLAHRELSANSRNHYRRILDLHILPYLGNKKLADIDSETVRKWHAELGRKLAGDAKERNLSTTGKSMQANAYRLLSGIFRTAVDDEVITTANPCKLKGAGNAKTKETKDRQALVAQLGVPDVMAVIAMMPERYRTMALVAAFAGLRFGELIGLQRQDIDLAAATLTVTRQLQWIKDENGEATWVECELKSKASQASLILPAFLVDALREHCARYVPDSPTAWVFTTPTGAHPHRATMRRTVMTAAKRAKLPTHVFPHLLRHFALTLVGQLGATNAEILAFGRHTDYKTAQIYQHATNDRRREIVSRIDGLIKPAISSGVIEGELVS